MPPLSFRVLSRETVKVPRNFEGPKTPEQVLLADAAITLLTKKRPEGPTLETTREQCLWRRESHKLASMHRLESWCLGYVSKMKG